ncbi:MAG: hypothetical protein JWO31_3669 [Phycisphaerales bacterium]|nr:hypothetical protein [Phycisphaerales bacterium]
MATRNTARATAMSAWAAVFVSARAATAAIIPADADTFVQRQASAVNTNFGNNANVAAKNHDGTANNADRVAFVRFTAPAAPAAVLSASLTLTQGAATSSTPTTMQLFGIRDGGFNENFVEGAGETGVAASGANLPLTWNNNGYTDAVQTAGTDNNVNDASPDLVLLDARVATGTAVGSTLAFFGPQLTAFVAADTNGTLAFIVTASTTNATYLGLFAPRDNADTSLRPALRTDADAVPEPASLAAVGVAAVGLLARRRAVTRSGS